MFEVIAKTNSIVRTVYGVRQNASFYNLTEFLIFADETWLWVDASWYIPSYKEET